MGQFGFAQQFAAPDYQTRAQAGLSVDPSLSDDAISAQAAQQLAMPPPQPQGQPQGQGGLPDIQVSPAEAALSWLMHGGTPAEAAQKVRGVKLQNLKDQIGLQQAQQLFKLTQGLPERDRLDYLTNPGKYAESDAKNIEPQNVAAGNSVLFRGGPNAPGGSGFFAPKTDISPAGVPYAITDTGYHSLAPQLPGKISVSPSGALVDENRGLTGESVSIPNNIKPGETPASFIPSLIGGKFPAVQAPAPTGQASGGAPASAPRGIRNNNFGNVRPPQGVTFDGQAGLDKDGYAVFADPSAGVKAAATVLQSYAKQGINTPLGIASKWAPAGDGKNDPVAYGHFLAGQLGVGPNDPVDLGNPTVQKSVLQGIFSFENGPKVMASWRAPAGGQRQESPAQAQNDTSPGFHALGPTKTPHILSPQEAEALGYPPGAVVEQAADGTTSPKTTGYGPEQIISLRSKLADAEPVKNFNIANDAYGAMVRAAAQPNGGMRAYALRDTFARLINPGAVARVGTIQAIADAQGIPANVKAYLMNLKGDGNVPPEIAQQILDVSHGFLAAHHSSAKALNDNYGQFATSHHLNPADVQAPGIGDAPSGRMQLGAPPPPQQRQPGTIYVTPRGPLIWTGQGPKPWKAFQ